MSIPSGIRTGSSLGRRIGSRRPQCLISPRGIVTTTSAGETPQSPQAASALEEPPKPSGEDLVIRKYPGRVFMKYGWDPKPGENVPIRKFPGKMFYKYQWNPAVGRESKPSESRVPRLSPFNAYKATPGKLVKAYTQKLALKSPMIIRNLPGFLDQQDWIDPLADPAQGAFKRPMMPSGGHLEPGFFVLRAILASALTRGDSDLDSHPTQVKSVFDDWVADCKMAEQPLEGDYPPLLQFRDWLRTSQFRDDTLDELINSIREEYLAKHEPLITFKAPLLFFRAIHQFNQERRQHNKGQRLEQRGDPPTTIPQAEDTADDQSHLPCVYKVQGLVVLQEAMTEEFPFPRIIRDIGQFTYKTKTCSLRVGVRPMRASLRRYRTTTVVIGQLAGHSKVTLIPPSLKSLDGRPLEFHPRVPESKRLGALQHPLGPRNLSLDGPDWSREFEDELADAGDVLLATLIPGDGLLVPEGWSYGVRSINYGMQLHSTATWFLERDDTPEERQEEFDRAKYLETFAPRVEI